MAQSSAPHRNVYPHRAMPSSLRHMRCACVLPWGQGKGQMLGRIVSHIWTFISSSEFNEERVNICLSVQSGQEPVPRAVCFAVALRPRLRPARTSPCSTCCLLAWRNSERQEGCFPGYLWSKIKARDDMHFFLIFVSSRGASAQQSLLHFCDSVGSP